MKKLKTVAGEKPTVGVFLVHLDEIGFWEEIKESICKNEALHINLVVITTGVDVEVGLTEKRFPHFLVSQENTEEILIEYLNNNNVKILICSTESLPGDIINNTQVKELANFGLGYKGVVKKINNWFNQWIEIHPINVIRDDKMLIAYNGKIMNK